MRVFFNKIFRLIDFVGSLTSILAFACPLAYLLPLLNASTLLKCSFYSTLYLYNLLKRDFMISNSPLLTINNKNNYSKLRNQCRMKRSSSYKLKVMMDLLPKFLRNSPLNNVETRSVKSSKLRKGITLLQQSVDITFLCMYLCRCCR